MVEYFPALVDNLRRSFHLDFIGTDSEGCSTYSIDLSRYKFNVSTQTPLIFLPEGFHRFGVKRITDKVSTLITPKDNIFIGVFESDVRRIKEAVNSIFPEMLIIDKQILGKLSSSSDPSTDFKKIICENMDILVISPYQVTGAATRSMFYGREKDIRRIISSPKSFGVWGMRRIGKTSLLQEVRLRLIEQRNYQPEKVRFIDCILVETPEEFFRIAAGPEMPRNQARFLDHESFLSHLRSSSRNGEQPIIFLLDEIDSLIQMELVYGAKRQVSTLLRSAYQSGYCRFVFSGFRIARGEKTNIGSPYFNFADDIYLEGLSLTESRKLILEPMEDLNMKVRNPGGLARFIYNDTGGLPQLIQFYCSYLLEQFESRKANVLDEIYLQDIYSDPRLDDMVWGTLMENTSALEQLIIYKNVNNPTFTVDEVRQNLIREGIKANTKTVLEALIYLSGIGILTSRKAQYSISNSVIVKYIMLRLDLPYLIDRTKTEIVVTK